MFSALSEGHGNFGDKLNLFVALAPVVNLGWCPSQLQQLKGWQETIQGTLKNMGINEIGGPTHTYTMRAFCLAFPLTCRIIDNMDSMQDTPYNRSDRVAIVDARHGNAASVRQLLHYLQIIKTKEYKQYDWGKKEN